jgi:uncharacterized phiE125 gp8 family phage protein
LLTAPAIEPLSLAEAKAFLRVETSDVTGALVAGSRIHVEAQTRRALITQSWRISADSWPDDGRLTILAYLPPIHPCRRLRIVAVLAPGRVIEMQRNERGGRLALNPPPATLRNYRGVTCHGRS